MRAMHVEKKVHDRFDNGRSANLGTAWLTRFAHIATGLNADDRIGNEINLVSMSATFFMKFDQASVTLTSHNRVSVFIQMAATPGVAPPEADLWEDQLNPISYRDRDHLNQFRRLFSKTFKLDKLNRMSTVIRFNWKGSLPVRFADGTNLSYTKNIVFVHIQSNSTVANPVLIDAQMRQRFTDN